MSNKQKIIDELDKAIAAITNVREMLEDNFERSRGRLQDVPKETMDKILNDPKFQEEIKAIVFKLNSQIEEHSRTCVYPSCQFTGCTSKCLDKR